MNPVEVDIEQLEKARAEGTPLVDVREPDEYVAGHVPGAILLPMSEIAERVDEVPADGTVYVICHVGGRSLQGRQLAAHARHRRLLRRRRHQGLGRQRPRDRHRRAVGLTLA